MRLEGTVFAFVDQCLGGMEGCEVSSPARVLVEIRFQHALAPGQHIPGVLDEVLALRSHRGRPSRLISYMMGVGSS